MNCSEAELLIHGYLDDELDLLHTVEIEKHLEACDECARHHSEQLGLRRILRSEAPYYTAPTRLRQRMEGRRHYAWMAPVAAAAVLAIAVWLVPRRDAAQDAVAGHIRSLMANHLTDVPSTDQHTVKPWFNGKLDFSPVVRDFTQQGFRLVGGRLDYLDGRPVAAVVYQRRAHIVNLFMWPAGSDRSETKSLRQGYNIVSWAQAGMEYRAVSDLNAGELQELVRLLR